jgi:hypothetical protein
MKTIAILSLVLLAGCTYLPVAKDKSAKAADEALSLANWGKCVGASMGAFVRRYPTLDEQIEQLKICSKENAR